MRLTVTALVAVSLSCVPALAQQERTYIDANQSCQTVLSTDDSVTETLIATYALGYLSAKSKPLKVTSKNLKVVLGVLADRCASRPDATLADLLRGKKTPSTADATPPPTGPGSEKHAHAFLTQFVQPDADIAALTKKITPTEAEIRMVYKGDLADALVDDYAALYSSGARIGPKRGQTEILTTYAMTDDLINRSAILRELPGGYKRVLPFMKPGYPMVEFKFVKPGESLGMRYNGLIYTGERWVLMPKPWRALK